MSKRARYFHSRSASLPDALRCREAANDATAISAGLAPRCLQLPQSASSNRPLDRGRSTLKSLIPMKEEVVAGAGFEPTPLGSRDRSRRNMAVVHWFLPMSDSFLRSGVVLHDAGEPGVQER